MPRWRWGEDSKRSEMLITHADVEDVESASDKCLISGDTT